MSKILNFDPEKPFEDASVNTEIDDKSLLIEDTKLDSIEDAGKKLHKKLQDQKSKVSPSLLMEGARAPMGTRISATFESARRSGDEFSRIAELDDYVGNRAYIQETGTRPELIDYARATAYTAMNASERGIVELRAQAEPTIYNSDHNGGLVGIVYEIPVRGGTIVELNEFAVGSPEQVDMHIVFVPQHQAEAA